MSFDLTAPYISLDTFKDEVGITDPDTDTEVGLVLSEGAELINNYCNRNFHLHSETRLYDAPFSEWLMVADLQSITTLTWYTTVLTAPDYLLVPQRGTNDYAAVLRLSGSPPRPYRWDVDPLGVMDLGLPWDQIEIVGIWAFKASYDSGTSTWTELVPVKVARANFMLSSRLWTMRITHYTGEGGGPQIGRKPVAPELMSGDVKDLLNPYILGPVPMLVGSPYGD